MKKILCLVFLIFIISNANSQTGNNKDISRSNECESTSINQIEIDACLFKKRENKINNEIKKLENKFKKDNNKNGIDALKKSQASWLEYRESTCDLFSAVIAKDFKSSGDNNLSSLINKGESANSRRSDCFEIMTDLRFKMLEDFNTKLK